VDRVSIERMCAGREFQVEGVDTEFSKTQYHVVKVYSVFLRRQIFGLCTALYGGVLPTVAVTSCTCQR